MATSGVSLPGAEAAAGDARGESRRDLLALRAAGDTYRFLDVGWRYLSAIDDDAPLALEVLKGMVKLGLGGPARELIETRRDLAAIAGAELRAGLAALPSGRVPWETLERTWRANLAALRRHQAHLRMDEESLRKSLDDFELFRSSDGRLHLSRPNPRGLRAWLPCLTDHAATEAAQPHEGRQPTLIIGLHLNGFVARFRANSARPAGEPQCPLHLAETQWHQLAAWLHSADHGAVLADPRVFLFAGPQAASDLERHLVEHEDLDVPRLRLGCHTAPSTCAGFDEAARRALQARERTLLAICSAIEAAARPASPAGAPLLSRGADIVAFASRFTTVLQHSMRDIGQVLSDLGYRFHLAIEPADHRITSALTVARAVESRPDLILLINHFRHEMPVPTPGVPLLTWIQDPTDVVLDRRTAERLGPIDFQAGFYYDRCVNDLGYPKERFFSVPFVPVSDVKFHDGPIPPNDRERYECDVAYVGHYRGTPAEHAQEMRRTSPEALHVVIDHIERRVAALAEGGAHVNLRDAGPIVDEALAAAGRRVDGRVRTTLASFLAYRLFDIRFRLETLESVADWAERSGRRFRVYGTGWERHPRLGRFAAGPVEHGEEARRAYRGAAVTIQTIPSGLPHQRTFEALLSGSLVLARWCPDDFDGLSPAAFRAARGDGAGTNLLLFRHGFRGLDRVVFDGPGALEARLEQALGNPAWRSEVVDGLRSAVAGHFTYRAVVPQVIEFIVAAASLGHP